MRRRLIGALLLAAAVAMTSATAASADTFSESSVALSGMYDAYAPSIITSGHRWDIWFGGWVTSDTNALTTPHVVWVAARASCPAK